MIARAWDWIRCTFVFLIVVGVGLVGILCGVDTLSEEEQEREEA